MIAGLIYGLAAIAACKGIAWLIGYADRPNEIDDAFAYGDHPALPPVMVHSQHDAEA